jgi:hypothetical protein
MPGLADCLSFLRLLIARGDPKEVPLAMSAIDDYLAMAPVSARRRGCACSSRMRWSCVSRRLA